MFEVHSRWVVVRSVKGSPPFSKNDDMVTHLQRYVIRCDDILLLLSLWLHWAP